MRTMEFGGCQREIVIWMIEDKERAVMRKSCASAYAHEGQNTLDPIWKESIGRNVISYYISI